MISNRTDFFPRNQTFWLYHGAAMAVILLAQGFIIFSWREQQLFNVVGSLVWVVYLTLALLTFRSHYNNHRWPHLGAGRLIVMALLCSFGISFVVITAMLTSILPFFWSGFSSPEKLLENDTTIATELAKMGVSNFAVTQLYAVSWIFIYIGITTNRRMRETELHNLKLANSLKAAQLSSLASQINPHFLFNSLNNIRFMIHENPNYADNTITALSEILRYSLESERKDKVLLKQEMAVVKRYLEVVSLQLEDRLQLELNVPETLLACQVPPMALHLLVENAVKHGMEHLKVSGVLTIAARDQSDSLLLTVSNPMAANTSAPERNTGTGLANIEQRLRLLYGDAATLVVDKDARAFCVTLILPKEFEE